MIEVRPAKKEDRDKIIDLHIRSWRENYINNISKEFLFSSMVEENRQMVWTQRFEDSNPNRYVAVAEYQNNFAGFICVHRNYHQTLGTLIDNLHVERHYQKLCIGTCLMHEAAKWINLNCQGSAIYLEVYSENIRARKFYKKLGGQQTTTQPFIVDAIDGGTTQSFHMVWQSSNFLLEMITRSLPS